MARYVAALALLGAVLADGTGDGYAAPSSGYDSPDVSYGAPGYAAPEQSYDTPDAGYGAPDTGYADYSTGTGYR